MHININAERFLKRYNELATNFLYIFFPFGIIKKKEE